MPNAMWARQSSSASCCESCKEAPLNLVARRQVFRMPLHRNEETARLILNPFDDPVFCVASGDREPGPQPIDRLVMA